MTALPKWYELALAEQGVERGELDQNTRLPSNPKVLAYFKDAGHPEVHQDATSWCDVFVGAMFARAGIKPSSSMMARSYLDWGVRLAEPRQGCLVIFSRGGPGSGEGHVTFFDHWAQTGIMVCLGGNQGTPSRVCFEDFGTEHVLGYRWPAMEWKPQMPETIAPAPAMPIAPPAVTNLVTTIAAGAIRHGLTIAGGYLVAQGLTDAATATSIEAGLTNVLIGMISIVAGLGWSIVQKIITHYTSKLARAVSVRANPTWAPVPIVVNPPTG